MRSGPTVNFSSVIRPRFCRSPNATSCSEASHMLRRATRVYTAGLWPSADAAGTLTLTFYDPFPRPHEIKDDSGAPLLLDLARAVVLNDGDALELGDGTLLKVRAAEEDLAEVHCS